MSMDSAALKNKIDSIDYPAAPYEGIEQRKNNKEILDTARRYRSEQYQKMKRGVR